MQFYHFCNQIKELCSEKTQLCNFFLNRGFSKKLQKYTFSNKENLGFLKNLETFDFRIFKNLLKNVVKKRSEKTRHPTFFEKLNKSAFQINFTFYQEKYF